MKFVLHKAKNVGEYWNGKQSLPDEINVMSFDIKMAEFELISLICGLHWFMTAFDLLTGAGDNSEKDTDITAVMTAFQMYIYPRMPLSNYSESEKRIKKSDSFKPKAINSGE